MLRKDENGNIEVFYTDDLHVKKLLDAERQKDRALKNITMNDADKKYKLQQRQKLASDLRKIKIARKEVLP